MVDAIEQPTTSPLGDAALSVLIWPGAGQANQGRVGLAAYLALESLACVVLYFAVPRMHVLAGIVFVALVAWAGIEAFDAGRRRQAGGRPGMRHSGRIPRD